MKIKTLNLKEKITNLKLMASDLLDLAEYMEELDSAILFEGKETIENIKQCINDFDLKGIIVKLLEIME